MTILQYSRGRKGGRVPRAAGAGGATFYSSASLNRARSSRKWERSVASVASASRGPQSNSTTATTTTTEIAPGARAFNFSRGATNHVLNESNDRRHPPVLKGAPRSTLTSTAAPRPCSWKRPRDDKAPNSSTVSAATTAAAESVVSILKGRNNTWKRATEPEQSGKKATAIETAETTTATTGSIDSVFEPSGALPAASLEDHPPAQEPRTTIKKGPILQGGSSRQLRFGYKRKVAPKRREFHRPGWNAPKRIRLDTSTTFTAASPNQQEAKQKEGKKASASVAGLTDFAYRHTNHKGSNAVVRVHSRQKARVCHQFLLGLPCTNERCRDRHDLPNQECAMPYCSFFQRQGMCLRSDCPFRHVKVNPRATQCPTFAALGYCEDVDCAMKHENPKSHQQLHDKKNNRSGKDLQKMSWHKRG